MSGFARAVRQNKSVEIKSINIHAHNFTKVVDIRIQAITEPPTMKGMVLVAFMDINASEKHIKALGKTKRSSEQAKQLSAMAQDVNRANEALQITREDMQTSQEKLKSTNEELTTSKEEMQSMNEELQTVNHELSAKLDKLSKASDDMNNLLNSTDIATLFLDNDLRECVVLQLRRLKLFNSFRVILAGQLPTWSPPWTTLTW
jgi:two-component system CheB/CheR fusion protein